MRSRAWLASLAVVLVAVAMRTLPLWHSPLPFNPDGIHQARWAAATLRNGSLPLARLATDDLLFPPLLAVVGRILGVQPMLVAQPVTAIVGAVPCLLGIAVTRRVARQWGWARRRAVAAAILAGALLAVEGLYLHRSMATDEQIVGMLFVPLTAVIVARAYATGRQAWAVPVAVLLVAFGPLHNLDAVVIGLTLTIVTALVVTRARIRRAAPLVGVTGAYWLYIAGYHLSVARFTPAGINQQTRLTARPGLLLAWVIFVAGVAVWLVNARQRTQRLLLGSGFALLFALVAVNAVVPVFPGTPSTHPVVLAGLLPLGLPVALAIWILPALDQAGPERLAIGGLLAAPFVLLGMAVTASLTPQYLNTAYRTTTFLHFPVLVLAALGTIALTGRLASDAVDRSHIRRGLRGGVVVVVLVAAAASVPIAFGGLSILNYKGVTTPAELEASQFAAAHARGSWTSDNHLVRIQPRTGSNGTEAPVYEWLRGGNRPPERFVLAQQSWTTTGAQFYPAPPETLSDAAYSEWRRTNNVVYVSGSGDRIVGVVPDGDTGKANGRSS